MTGVHCVGIEQKTERRDSSRIKLKTRDTRCMARNLCLACISLLDEGIGQALRGISSED